MAINESIQNAKIISLGLASGKARVPSQYSGRQKRYYEDESTEFLKEYAQYSSDFIDAEVQGTNPDDFYEWKNVKIRMADVVKPSASLTSNFDDYKNIIVAGGVDYLPKGAKIKAMGGYWLVTNPANISGSDGNAIIRRCDAVYNYLDFYGNVCSEPLCINDLTTNANDNDSQRSTMITKGYLQVLCQFNDVTKNLDNNARLILGRNAYRITGYADYSQEFTGDYNSVHMIGFTIRYEEPNMAIDDMENRVAGGKTFNWEIKLSGKKALSVGEKTRLSAVSYRTFGEKTSEVEIDNYNRPVEYIWESSNENIASVDVTGHVLARQLGMTVITATLVQNPLISANFAVYVENEEYEPRVEFKNTVPETLRYAQSTSIEAVYIVDGEPTDEVVEWSFDDADKEAYSYEVNDNTATIKCWRGSVRKLRVTASVGNYKESAMIELEGI